MLLREYGRSRRYRAPHYGRRVWVLWTLNFGRRDLRNRGSRRRRHRHRRRRRLRRAGLFLAWSRPRRPCTRAHAAALRSNGAREVRGEIVLGER